MLVENWQQNPTRREYSIYRPAALIKHKIQNKVAVGYLRFCLHFDLFVWLGFLVVTHLACLISPVIGGWTAYLRMLSSPYLY